MNKKTTFKIVKLLISQLVMLCLLFTNIVSAASLNTANGIIYAKLSKNEELTNEIFQSNSDGYLTINDVENIEILINTNKETATLSGDIDINLSGEINTIDYKDVTGYSGIFEGELSDGTYILLDVTYTENEVLATLSSGYLGEEFYEIAIYGEITNLLLNLDNSNALSYQNNNQEIELNGENSNINFKGVSTRTLDNEPRHQGGININTVDGNAKVGELNIFFPNEVESGDPIIVDAKLNTSSTTASYLKNYVYNDATAVYANPDKFYMKIHTNHSKIRLMPNSYEPVDKTIEETIYVPIPYITSSSTKIKLTVPSFNLTVSSIDAQTSSTYGANTDTVYWEWYRNEYWSNSIIVGDEFSRQGVSVAGTWIYNGSLTSNTSAAIEAYGKIRYRVSAVIDGRYKVYSFTTPPRTVTRHVTIVPA